MKSKKQPVVRKPSKRITDSRRVRFGGGNVRIFCGTHN